jgi:hypothetical protein
VFDERALADLSAATDRDETARPGVSTRIKFRLEGPQLRATTDEPHRF